jgi:hypothetical protein
VSGLDGDWPTEAEGERDGDVAIVGSQLHVERWTTTGASVETGKIMLFIIIIFPNSSE